MTDTPPTTAEAEAEMITKFQQLLEARVLLYFQQTFGDDVAKAYLDMRLKDDLPELLLFEATYGVNLDTLFKEESAKIVAEVEAKQT